MISTSATLLQRPLCSGRAWVHPQAHVTHVAPVLTAHRPAAALTALDQRQSAARLARPPQLPRRGGRRSTVVCAKKVIPTPGKVEQATEVAVAAYSGLPLFWQATLRLAGVTAGAIFASQLIIRLLKWAAKETGEEADELGGKLATEDNKEQSTYLRLLETALKAAYKPVTLLLPAATAILALRETSRWLELLVDLNDDHLPRIAAHVAALAIKGFGYVDDAALACSKVALVILGYWFVIAWKDLLLDMAIRSPRTSEKMDRILMPFSTLLTWVMGASGILSMLHVVGFNIQPLLTAGGVSGVAIAFGAQKLTQSVLSGAMIFLTTPFVVGERVSLLGSGGSEIVSGTIESVTPMNTIVRQDDGVPVLIPNSVASSALVANRSRIKTPKTV